MFKTYQGVNEDSAAELYLRPETAQGIFVNFQNVMRTTRKKLPAGIAQIGKSFRNEITPGSNFIFRVREFEQMELEFFCKPGEDLEWFNYWRAFCRDWLLSLGIREENLRLRDHEPEKLAFYSKATTDFEFLFPFGWGELWGIADRTDYDLKQHQEHSGKSMEYLDPTTNERFIPYCVEPSLGVDRAVLAFLCNAYDEEELEGGDVRTVLHLHPALAPFTVSVMPLQKNKLGEQARALYAKLAKKFRCDYDETGSIGKRYRRADEIGTPYCICVDFDTESTGNVTVRDRDTMQQEVVAIDNLIPWLESSWSSKGRLSTPGSAIPRPSRPLRAVHSRFGAAGLRKDAGASVQSENPLKKRGRLLRRPRSLCSKPGSADKVRPLPGFGRRVGRPSPRASPGIHAMLWPSVRMICIPSAS